MLDKIYTFTLFFRWYDLWIGAYIDTKGRAVYLCPVPCFGIKVSWRKEGEPKL